MENHELVESRGMKPRTKSADREIWRALFFYNAYRVMLAAVALTLVLLDKVTLEAGVSDIAFYRGVALAYLALSLFSTGLWFRRSPGSAAQSVFSVLTDVVVLMFFIHASGGLGHSAAEMLLFVPVAASGILLSGRMALFSASVAIVLLLLQAMLNVLADKEDISLLLHAGLLGMALLVTAFIVNRLATKAKKSEELVKLHAASLEDMGQLNELIIQTMDSGVLVLDVDDKPLFMNNRARVLLGVDGADLSGRSLSDISRKLDVERLRWQRDGECCADFTCHKTHTVIQPTFSSLASDRALGTLVLIEETGAARRREQQAKLAALGRLTGSIAHEIRNPLSAVSQAAQLLSSGAGVKQQSRLIELIEKNTARIDRIVEDVMSLNKSDQLQRAAAPLRRWLTSFVEKYLAERDLDSETIACHAEDVSVLVDMAHLEQIMRNLLDNAMQHGEFGENAPKPVAKIVASAVDDGRIYLDVHDNGPGVAPGLVETIFEPFFTGRADGTGLGLYISRELCETNGGHLEYVRDDVDDDDSGFFRITLERAA